MHKLEQSKILQEEREMRDVTCSPELESLNSSVQISFREGPIEERLLQEGVKSKRKIEEMRFRQQSLIE